MQTDTTSPQCSPPSPGGAGVDETPRPASGALTKTGGFLRGYTHTLQPYIGCRFGCAYCYVAGLSVHHFHQPTLDWGAYAHPRTGIAARLAKELTRLDARDLLATTSIFMSSATDPYQPLERHWRLSRACLDAFIAQPPGRLVLQTRSPLVEDDFDRLRPLGDRLWLSITLETDRDDVRRAVAPRCPSVARRVELIRRARAAGLQVQVAVSPCLPFSSVATFGQLLLDLDTRVVVDTYTSGDGQAGKRTARTTIPAAYRDQGWGDWRAEDEARALYTWLHERIGPRAGWSQAGFAALATPAPERSQA